MVVNDTPEAELWDIRGKNPIKIEIDQFFLAKKVYKIFAVY